MRFVSPLSGKEVQAGGSGKGLGESGIIVVSLVSLRSYLFVLVLSSAYRISVYSCTSSTSTAGITVYHAVVLAVAGCRRMTLLVALSGVK